MNIKNIITFIFNSSSPTNPRKEKIIKISMEDVEKPNRFSSNRFSFVLISRKFYKRQNSMKFIAKINEHGFEALAPLIKV